MEEKGCPTRKITVEKDAVRWGTTCIKNYTCIHWCPDEAIGIDGRTAGKPRYHHPDVKLTDILYRRGDQ